MEYIVDDKHKNKKIKILDEIDIFIFSSETIEKYKYINPTELIIIYTSYDYSPEIYSGIYKGGIKTNVKKIITTDSVLVNYLSFLDNEFKTFFPNCNIIQINSFESYFLTIIKILDDFETIKYLEYNLDDNIIIRNCIKNYNLFSDFILTGKISNIKHIKIKNNITHKIECLIENKIIFNLISYEKIKKKNDYTQDIIVKNNIDNKYVNEIYLEYIDIKNSIFIKDYILNIKQNLYFMDGFFL
jgi:hypothetical protein